MITYIGGNKLAKRPVFLIKDTQPFYAEEFIDFKFYSGFAEVQKKKSIISLHDTFLERYPNRKVLEISSKSENSLGVQLSAFNLIIQTKTEGDFSVESAFQSSKVFENGGPYKDMLKMTSKEAKKDSRLKSSGRLVCFEYFGRRFNLNPTTYFYNWLYINALSLHEVLGDKLLEFDSFTDIEFNPDKSINCQARAAAIYVSLRKKGMLERALESKELFLKTVYLESNNIKDNNIIDEAEQISIWSKL